MTRKLILILCFGILFMACSEEVEQIIPPEYESVDISAINRVLILGNSITLHGSKPEIGWNGNWGMAASAMENDYVHLLESELQSINPNLELNFANIAEFETTFWRYYLNKLSSLKNFNADLLIINLGENITEHDAQKHNFGEHLSKLIDYVATHQNVVIVDSFWPKKHVNRQIYDLCILQDYRFATVFGLSKSKHNTAQESFAPPVANHPSDRGVKEIYKRIKTALGLN